MKLTRFLLFLSLIVLSSCIVSKKKFDDMLAQKVRVEGDLADRNKLSSELEESLKKIQQYTAKLNVSYKANQKRLTDLNKEYDQLNTNYKNLLTNSGKLNQDVAQQRNQLLAIQASLDRTRKANDSLGVSLQEREKKVKELEHIMANKDKAVQNLKNQISNALLNFKESDLTVKVKNGKVYVSLAEQLLFGSGSIEVDKKGIGALQQLAKALKDQKDIHFLSHPLNISIFQIA